ncbi:MAG: N-acetylmuramic acid 6-phosphate etherase [Thiolinea sp.]
MTAEPQSTEHIDPAWQGLDQWPAEMIGDRLCQAQLNALQCLQHSNQQIAIAGRAAAEQLQQSASGRLIYCGAGSAGAQACIDGLELPGTFGWPQERLVLSLAGGWDSFFNFGGATEDDTELAQQAAETIDFKKDDVLIGVSASGSTAYTLKMMALAQNSGALTIGICNNADSAMHNLSSYNIVLNTGPEAIAGSTRMAAGSAQKIALNSLSTLIMAKLGYLYDNLMIRLQVSNKKLAQRAIGITTQISGCTKTQAQQYLEATDYRVPEAVLMTHGLTATSAQALLEQHRGSLRAALQNTTQH